MSRIGKAPVVLPAGVEVYIDGSTVKVKGPHGELESTFSPAMNISLSEGVLTVERPNDSKENKSLHGLTRALIQNMVTGVSAKFTKNLEMVGVGYKSSVSGNTLVINAGYSDPVEMEIPAGLTVDVPQPTKIAISGIDKQMVGAFAANIRKVRPPEPYKGKGIKYADEKIKRKVGKTGSK